MTNPRQSKASCSCWVGPCAAIFLVTFFARDAAADPDLWERLFPPETPVRPYAFKDHAKRMLHEFPVRGVLDFLQRTYGALGAMGTNFPSIGSIEEPGELLAPFLPLGEITEWISDWIPYKQKLEDLAEQELKSVSFLDELVRGHRQGEEREGGVVYEEVAEEDLDQDSRDAQNHFFQAYRFYYRPGSRRPELGEGYVEPRPKAPDFDFHQMVAQLGDHPAVLRRLGLIVDLVVDRPAGIGENGSVRVVPANGGLPEDPPSPSTCSWCLLATSKTLTVPRTLTLAPSTGSARQKGTCSAAR